MIKPLSDEAIKAEVNRAFDEDYLLEHRVESRGHWEEIAPIIARKAEDERTRQIVEWGIQYCPHLHKDNPLRRNCEECWQELKKLLEEK